MKTVRRLMVKMLLWALGTRSFHRVKKEDVEKMWNFMATAPELRKLEAMLMQMSEDYRNMYMRTGSETYKGMVVSFVSMREFLMAHKPKRKAQSKLAEAKKIGDRKVHRAVKY